MAEKITLAHGSGGKASHELIEGLFVAVFGSRSPGVLEDSAVLEAGREKIAFSTDSFVVDPIFFQGAISAASLFTAPLMTWPCGGRNRFTSRSA